MGGLLAKSEVDAKVKRNAGTANVTGQISKHGIFSLQDATVENSIQNGGISGAQYEDIRATVRERASQVMIFLTFVFISIYMNMQRVWI